MPWRTVSFRSS